MRAPIFKDLDLQKKFDREGYVVVSMVSAEQLNSLNLLFESAEGRVFHEGFVSTSYSSDNSFKKDLSRKIVEILIPSYEEVFVDYQPFGASFLYKTPGENSVLPIHQDWTILDEEKYYAINCWIPISNITEKNGPLMVFPGSHFDNYKTLRAPTIPFFYQNDEKIVYEYLKPILPKPGEVVLLNQSIIHYSPSNNSNKVRVALTAGVKSKGAPMLFHFFDQKNNKIERYRMPEDFLISFENFFEDIHNKPNGDYMDSIPVNKNLILDKKEVQKTFQRFEKLSLNKKNNSNFLFKLFSKVS